MTLPVGAACRCGGTYVLKNVHGDTACNRCGTFCEDDMAELRGIQRGIADAKAGRVKSLAQIDAEYRRGPRR